MSAKEKTKHGVFYKVTEVGLGTISAASLVLNLVPVPGASIMSALLQGGVTVAQTGLDLVTDGVKKASISFVSGTALTAMSFIPELGAAARGAGLVAEKVAVKGAATMTEEALVDGAGTAAKEGGFWKTITAPFRWVKNAAVDTSKSATAVIDKKFPAIGKRVITPINDGLGRVAKGTENLMKRNRFRLGDTARYLDDHKWVRRGIQGGLFVGGTGLSMINDTPPANLLNPDTYNFSQTQGPTLSPQQVRQMAVLKLREGEPDAPASNFRGRLQQDKERNLTAQNSVA